MEKHELKRKLMDVSLLIGVIIGGFILSILIFMAIEFLQKKIFVPNDCILYTFKKPVSYLMFIFGVEVIILFFALLNKFRESSLWEWARDIYIILKNKWQISLVSNVLLLYICLSSVAVVTPEKIVDFTFYNPMGTTYKYEDIADVECGFNEKKLNLSENKEGKFYYKVKFHDHKEINFADSKLN